MCDKINERKQVQRQGMKPQSFSLGFCIKSPSWGVRVCLVSNVVKHSQQDREEGFIISSALITFKGYALW